MILCAIIKKEKRNSEKRQRYRVVWKILNVLSSYTLQVDAVFGVRINTAQQHGIRRRIHSTTRNIVVNEGDYVSLHTPL